MKILKYSTFNKSIEMADLFLENIDSEYVEPEKYDDILKKIIHDLRLNGQLALKFGTGLTAMYPLVSKLVENMSLNIELKTETVVLMTVACITITYLEETKDMKEKAELERDSRSMLEELKLRGVGNGIIKKLVACIKSIENIFKIIYKQRRTIINGVFDMFAYSAIAIPLVNAILFMIDKYHMDANSLPSNFLSLGLGVTTIAAKHGMNYILSKLGRSVDKEVVMNDIENSNPILKKGQTKFVDTEYVNDDGEKLISEDDN